MKFPFHKENNKMVKLDFSMIRNVRVPHQQFETIKNKAKYLIVEDRDNGEILSFIRENDDKNTELFKVSKLTTGIFIRANGSIGFKYGEVYKFVLYYYAGYLHLRTTNGLWDMYLNKEKLLENWRILDDN